MQTAIYLVIIFGLISARPANAYLDPGSGSFLFQIIAAAVLGGLFTVKAYARKLSGLFRKKPTPAKKPTGPTDK